MTRAVERLTAGVQSLADILSLDPPVLPTAASLSKSSLQIVESGSSFQVREDADGGGIWDDEEERKFYEELVDLAEVVPAGLLGIKEKKQEKGGDDTAPAAKEEVGDQEEGDKDQDEASAKEARKRDEDDIHRQLAQLDLQSDPDTRPSDTETPVEPTGMARTATDGSVDSHPPIQDDGAEVDTEVEPASTTDVPGVVEEEGLQSGPAARLTALFAALPEANNREVVDKLAVEFAFLNSKAARKRLIKVSSPLASALV
jgi:regulator of nonsense transcripts 2